MTANGPDAPWNQVDSPAREFEVTVSITLSKTIKVMVDDYDVEKGEDEDGCYLSFDFSGCDFNKAVREQIILPHELAKYTEDALSEVPECLKGAIKDCKDWSVDELEIIPE